MPKSAGISPGLLLAALFITAAPVSAQTVRFPSGGVPATNTAFQQGGGFAQPGGTFTPPANAFTQGGASGLAPVQPPTGFAPYGGVPNPAYTAPGGVPANSAPSLLGQPTFDPFSTSQGAAATGAPAMGYPQAQGLNASAPFGPPSQPLYAPPGQAGFPQQPQYLYPEGYQGGFGQGLTGQDGIFGPQGLGQPGPYLKLFENLRLTHTWVNGDQGAELDTNDVEIATTLNIPNFAYSGHPISISPGFIFHFWAGPSPPIMVDLPPRAYSTYTTFDWNPMATPQFGAELSSTIGLYSDFNAINHDSIRLLGKALFVYHVTPKFTVKGGIEYLDRVKIKLLPAGGVVWTPNERVKFDIYFPRPKLAQYLVTIGTTEVWWYIAGEYGYGSWTIEYPYGSVRTDINDIRVMGGLEWVNNASTMKGFFEMGYVFDREVDFAETPGLDFKLLDSFMLRSGIAF